MSSLSSDKKYLIAYTTGTTVTPLCVLLNGPIGLIKQEGNEQQQINLTVFEVRNTNPSHQAALRSLLCHRTAVYISLSSPAAVAVISHISAPTVSMFRTMTNGTVLVVGGQIEIVDKKNKSKSTSSANQPRVDEPHDLEVEGDIRLVLDVGLCKVHLFSGRIYLDGLLWAMVESDNNIKEKHTQSQTLPAPRKLPYPSHAQATRDTISRQFQDQTSKLIEPITRGHSKESFPRLSASFEKKLAASGGIFVESVIDLPTEPVINESQLELQIRKKRIDETHLSKCVDTRKVIKNNAFKVIPEQDGHNYNTNEPTYRFTKDQ